MEITLTRQSSEMDLAAEFTALEGSATVNTDQVARLRVALATEGPSLPSRILARYNQRFASIERRAALPPPAFAFDTTAPFFGSAPLSTLTNPPASTSSSTVTATVSSTVIAPVLDTGSSARDAVVQVRDKVGKHIALNYGSKKVALHLENLEQCHVVVTSPLSVLSACGLRHCTLWLGEAHASVFIDKSEHSIFALSAAQVRLRGVTCSTVTVCANSAPILEDSTDVTLAPHSSWLPSVSLDQLKMRCTEASEWREWRVMQDMSWARPNEASPNWRFIDAPPLSCTKCPC